MCGREVRWVGRLRGRETVEANYVKDNEIRHSGIRGQERVQCVPSSPWSLATPRFVTADSTGFRDMAWTDRVKARAGGK